MKAILEFNLDDVEDEIAYTRCIEAKHMVFVNNKFNNNMSNNQVWVKNNLDNDILDYDYDIVKDNKKIELKYSGSSDWNESIVGDICAKLKDDGNGIKIKIGDKKIKLSYSDLTQLKCLLLCENDEHIEIRETNTIKMFK